MIIDAATIRAQAQNGKPESFFNPYPSRIMTAVETTKYVHGVFIFIDNLTPELSCVAHLRARPQHECLYLTTP